jgi:hypothetical protein
MTFGKDQDARKAGIKGNRTKSDLRNWRMSLAIKKKWQDPDFRQKHIQSLLKYQNKTKEEFSEMGKRSRIHENLVAEKIKDSFDFLFKPYEVCDRIGIKNNKIFFIEIKSQKNKTLTEKQRHFKRLVGNSFIIQY